MDVQELKKLLASHLCEPDRLKAPDSLPTGFAPLDRFVEGGGIPKGALSLFVGELGTGGTSLWIEAADRLLAAGRWVAWINHEVSLSPLPLEQRGLALDRFVAIDKPASEEHLFWTLQELMSSSLFDLIGCDLGDLNLKEHQLRKLQVQAREANIALVFLASRSSRAKPTIKSRPHGTNALPPSGASPRRSSSPRTLTALRGSAATLFSLILSFEKRQLIIERALHRPTPHRIARSVSYDRFTLHTTDRIVTGPSSSARSAEELAAHGGEHARVFAGSGDPA